MRFFSGKFDKNRIILNYWTTLVYNGTFLNTKIMIFWPAADDYRTTEESKIFDNLVLRMVRAKVFFLYASSAIKAAKTVYKWVFTTISVCFSMIFINFVFLNRIL